MNTTTKIPQFGILEGWPGCDYPDTVPVQGFYGNVYIYIWYIFPILHVVFGTFGNVMTSIVIFRNFRKMTSTSVMLLALACSDTMFLYMTPFRNWLLYIFKVDFRGFSDFGCKILILLVYSTYQASSWFLVMLTFERVFCIVRPHKVKLYFTTKKAIIAVCVIVVLITGHNTHVFYGFGNHPVSEFLGREGCQISQENYITFYRYYWHWIHFATSYIVPCTAIVFGNTFIVYKLRNSAMDSKRAETASASNTRKNDTNGTTSKLRPTRLSKQKKSVTLMLIMLSLIFIISQTPLTIFLICESHLLYDANKYACTDFLEYLDKAGKFKFTEAIVHNLGYLNSSINFFLYVLSGSRFRKDVKALLMCRRLSRAHVVFSETRNSSLRNSDLRHSTSL